jgi:hypothetical protein
MPADGLLWPEYGARFLLGVIREAAIASFARSNCCRPRAVP